MEEVKAPEPQRISGGLALMQEIMFAYEAAMRAENIAEPRRGNVHNRVVFPNNPAGLISADEITDDEGHVMATRMHAPGTDEPVFDDRGLEVETFPIVPESMVYPLIAACWCGKNLRQRAEHGSWEH